MEVSLFYTGAKPYCLSAKPDTCLNAFFSSLVKMFVEIELKGKRGGGFVIVLFVFYMLGVDFVISLPIL